MDTRDELARRLGLALLDALGLALADALPAPPAPVADAGVRLYRLDEVARRLGLSLTSVKALLGREIEVVHQGRAVMVPSDALDAYIARLRTAERQRVQGEPTDPIAITTRRQSHAPSTVRSRTR